MSKTLQHPKFQYGSTSFHGIEPATPPAIRRSFIPDQARQEWIRDSRLSQWLAGTAFRIDYVLTDSIADLRYMIGDRLRPGGTMLDVGCGRGHSFALLDQHFEPRQILGIDIDASALRRAASRQMPASCAIDLVHGTALQMDLPDRCFDLVFCHQLIQRISGQSKLLAELHRVLVPGGFLLCSEACRPWIESLRAKVLTRHPDIRPRSADEYIELISAAGFELDEFDTKKWAPWWSRADFGLWEKLDLPPRRLEPTQVLVVARKSLK